MVIEVIRLQDICVIWIIIKGFLSLPTTFRFALNCFLKVNSLRPITLSRCTCRPYLATARQQPASMTHEALRITCTCSGLHADVTRRAFPEVASCAPRAQLALPDLQQPNFAGFRLPSIFKSPDTINSYTWFMLHSSFLAMQIKYLIEMCRQEIKMVFWRIDNEEQLLNCNFGKNLKEGFRTSLLYVECQIY